VINLNGLTKKQLKELRDKLYDLQLDQKDNALDYMQWKAYKKQFDMMEAIYKRMDTKKGPNIFVVFGGNRAGKTELGAGVVATMFKNKPGLKCWCSTVSDLSVGVQQAKLFKLIRDRDIEYGEYNSVRGWKNNIVISKTGGKIQFKTYEQGREAFQGDDLDLIWFDEEVPWSIYQECIARVTDRQGVILLTFTALKGYTRLVTDLWGKERDDVLTEILSVKDNPFMNDEAKKQFMQSVSEEDYATRIDGKPHLKEGLIYKEFKDIHKIERFDYISLVRQNPGRWKLSEGIDPHNRTPHHWLRFLYDSLEDSLYVVEELKAPEESMRISHFSKMLREQRRGVPELEYTQIDTSAMTPDIIKLHPDEHQDDVFTIRTEFAQNGIPTILCMKDNSVGIALTKERLRATVNAEGKQVAKPKLHVFNDLKGIISEFEMYQWASYHSDLIAERNEKLNKPRKKDDHYMDILKYEVLRRHSQNNGGKIPSRHELYSGMGY
jgi:phage terminase large subunit-like protein